MMSGSIPSPIPPSILALPPYATTSPSRLQALYSDISRQKHSNPTSYHSNVEWWRKALEVIVSSGLQTDGSSRLVLRADARLMERVRVQGVGKPLALGAVITELRASKALIPLADFLGAKESIYDPGWLPARIAAFVVGKPLWWALEQMGVVGEEGLLGGGSSRSNKDTSWWGEYVFVSLLERAAGEVLERQARRVGGVGDRLYSFDGFRQEFGSVLGAEGSLTEGDATVLLKFLERDKKAVLFDKEVIKFLADDLSAPREINGADRGILELRGAVQNLHAQVDELQHKMDECTLKAAAALRQKQKAVALSHLRLKKQLEDLLSKRLGSLDNLESTLLRVEAAAGDIEIMKSYESSTATLRAILGHPSLQKESIEATLDALAEVNADAKEVDEAVRIGAEVAVGVSDVIDEGELEDELRALVLEAEQEKQEKAELDQLAEAMATQATLEGAGEVPDSVPSSTTDGTRLKVTLT
ncbi:putative snf7 [Lyophyllum shimeji]|uniref:Snf7 n=1 Tax=Lyophyllum shimeji TaxID=47721 RepID=A0A9P3PF50_LYOSH|nr:putative snf7 [Lyophyllum shimeji]